MDCTDDKELVPIQYVVGVIVLGIAHNLRHSQDSQVRTKALHWGVDTLSLGFSLLRLVCGVDVGEPPKSSNGRPDLSHRLDNSSLLGVPLGEGVVGLKESLPPLLSLFVCEVYPIVVSSINLELSPSHSVDKSEVYGFGLFALFLLDVLIIRDLLPSYHLVRVSVNVSPCLIDTLHGFISRHDGCYAKLCLRVVNLHHRPAFRGSHQVPDDGVSGYLLQVGVSAGGSSRDRPM